MHGVKCDVSGEKVLALKIQYNYCCAYCGLPPDKNNPLQIDHMIPLSKGGLHVMSNLLPACRSCNLKKFNMDWLGWCNLIGFEL